MTANCKTEPATIRIFESLGGWIVELPNGAIAETKRNPRDAVRAAHAYANYLGLAEFQLDVCGAIELCRR